MTRDQLVDTPEEPTVSLREKVYSGAVWDVVRETFDYGDGQLVRDFVDHTGASAVLALNDRDEVLLLRQYRHPVRSRNWELPAGLLDQPGEDPRECAIRELAEEASYEATDWTHMTTLNVSPGGSNELIHIFLARGLSLVSHDYVRTGEEADLEVVFWPLAQAVQAALHGKIRNQISVTGLLFAHLWHERR